MFPVQEQGKGHGIGLNYDEFVRRFDEICKQHRARGQAAAFAFIFYDFEDNAVRRILKSKGGFAQLDRLSGNRMTVFYLHARSREATDAFNAHFLAALNIEEGASFPCIAFFKVNGEQIDDVEIAQLDNANLVQGFHEIFEAIERYLDAKHVRNGLKEKATRWLKKSPGVVSYIAVRESIVALGKWLANLI